MPPKRCAACKQSLTGFSSHRPSLLWGSTLNGLLITSVVTLLVVLYSREARLAHSDPVFHPDREKVNSSWCWPVDDRRPLVSPRGLWIWRHFLPQTVPGFPVSCGPSKRQVRLGERVAGCPLCPSLHPTLLATMALSEDGGQKLLKEALPQCPRAIPAGQQAQFLSTRRVNTCFHTESCTAECVNP